MACKFCGGENIWNRDNFTNLMFLHFFEVIRNDCIKCTECSALADGSLTLSSDGMKAYFQKLYNSVGIKADLDEIIKRADGKVRELYKDVKLIKKNRKQSDLVLEKKKLTDIQELKKNNKDYQKRNRLLKDQIDALSTQNRLLAQQVEKYRNIAERAVNFLNTTNAEVQQTMKEIKPRKNDMKNIVNKRDDIISARSNNNIISTNIHNYD